jgi:hypothetical protein
MEFKLRDVGSSLPGFIACRFQEGSRNMRHLGEFFKSRSLSNFQPYFEVWEDGNQPNKHRVSATTRCHNLTQLTKVFEQLIINSDVIQRMTNKASFDVDMFKLYQISRTSLVNISLCLTERRRHSDDSFPISGFPRLLTLDDTPLCECCYID